MVLLKISNLKKSFQGNEIALRDVSLTIENQEVIALLGLSGSGKSTLLRCINRLTEPDSGSIKLENLEITNLNKRELRKVRAKMGMIFQEFNLVNRLTVLENVLSGTLGVTSLWRAVTRAFPPNDIFRALELCERVGISSQVEKRADQLSGGQRQRVGIARALMQNPTLLLVDEPTSSLDPKIGREVMTLMCEVARERDIPLLFSVHDISLAKDFSQRIIGLKEGEKIFDKKTSSLDDKSLEQIYKIESGNSLLTSESVN
jgi:phosphonate transport system ATP-binding protein